MFCKRKIELEMITTGRQNFNLFVPIKGTFSLERSDVQCNIHKKPI